MAHRAQWWAKAHPTEIKVMNRIKKGDHVIVTAGKDKGKQGDVVRVLGDRKSVV